MISAFPPTEKTAATVNAVELKPLTIQGIVNSVIDPVLIVTFAHGNGIVVAAVVVVVEKAKRAGFEQLGNTPASPYHMLVRMRVIDESEVKLPIHVNQLLARNVCVSYLEFYAPGEAPFSKRAASVRGRSLAKLQSDNHAVSTGVENCLSQNRGG